MAWLEPIKLDGSVVTLEPLDMRHVEPLKAAVMDGEYWKLWFANIPSPDHMENYVARAIQYAEKSDIAFAVKFNDTNKIVGTRYPEQRSNDSAPSRTVSCETTRSCGMARSAIRSSIQYFNMSGLR